MDNELMIELNRITRLTDVDDIKKAIVRICHYILTLNYAPMEYTSQISNFIEFACENLPSSNLPMMISRKFNIPIKRKRKVCFGGTQICQIDPESYLSYEGKQQKNREALSLGISNTDVFKSFRPKMVIEEGEENVPIIIPLFNKEFENKYTGPLFKNNIKMPVLSISVEEILQNPGILSQSEELW